MKKQLWLYAFILIFPLNMLVGCAGLADYSVDLPGDYSIIRSSAHQITIAPKIGENHWAESVIPSEVVAVDFNDEYIFAKQVLLVPDERGYKQPPKKTKEDDYRYWILDIQTGEVTGPLSLKNFEKVQEKLQLTVQFTPIEKLKRNN